jgi:competence protein ComFC
MKGEEFLRVNSPATRGFPGGWLNTVRAALLSVVFPAGCRICEQLLTEATRIPICRNCLDSFAPMTETVCDKCGRPVEGDWASDDEVFVCPTCKNEAWGGYAFDRVRSWAVYEGALVRAILFLKFENIEPLGKLFAQWLAEIVKQGGPAFEADVVVPVPLHRQRERERGYNQAALIAKPLAKLLGLPYKSVLLTRVRPRPDKYLLNYEERWEAVRGAFATRPGSQVDNLRVLLVDDVMTSGATLDSCAKALREAGARSVIGLTVARAVLKNATERLQ